MFLKSCEDDENKGLRRPAFLEICLRKAPLRRLPSRGSSIALKTFANGFVFIYEHVEGFNISVLPMVWFSSLEHPGNRFLPFLDTKLLSVLPTP